MVQCVTDAWIYDQSYDLPLTFDQNTDPSQLLIQMQNLILFLPYLLIYFCRRYIV